MGVADRQRQAVTTTVETIEEASLLDQAIDATFQRATDPSELIFDREKFDQMLCFAKLVAQQSILPKHLGFEKVKEVWQPLSDEQRTANCFRVVNQASRWGVDPFAIIDLTYVVGGKLGYEGKLVAGIINAKGGLEKSLDYTFEGSGRDRTVTVHGIIDGKNKTVDLKYDDAVTVGKDGKDSPQWTRDPDQKLIYSGVMKWARRWKPEVMLGILTDDDLLRIKASEDAKAKTKPRRRKSVKQEDALTSASSLNDEPVDDKPPAKEAAAKSKPAPPAKSKAADKPAAKKEAKKPPAEKELPPWFVGLEAALADAASADAVQVIYDERVEQCASPAARAKLAQLCDERGDQFPPAPTEFNLDAARSEIGKADTLERLNAIKAKWLPSCKEDDEFNLDKLIDSRHDDIAETRGEKS